MKNTNFYNCFNNYRFGEAALAGSTDIVDLDISDKAPAG